MDCMSREIAIITSIVNIEIYIQVLDHFLIPLIENIFDDKQVIFLDDNASSHGMGQSFSARKTYQFIEMASISPDLNQ